MSVHVPGTMPIDSRLALTEYREELQRLALFLTGDKKLAQVCVVNACRLAETYNDSFLEWLQHWARRATIASAIKLQQVEISELSTSYEKRPCPHRVHATLSPGEIELLRAQPQDCAVRFDLLNRFALVMFGVEKYAPQQSALMLGVSETAFASAYCAALESLKTIAGRSRTRRPEAPGCAGWKR